MKHYMSGQRLGVALLAGLALAALSGCSGVEYSEISDAVLASENVERRLEQINGRYIVGATDSIQLLVTNGPGLSGGHTIRPDGYITLELIGDIYVEGMVPMKIADVLTKALQVYIRDVDVTVRVTGFNSKKYYMFGETGGVGEHAFDGDVTILRAFARARGVTTRAAWDRIRLVRASTRTRQIFKINLQDIITRGEWDTNVQLKANDIVYVPPTVLARIGYLIDNILFPFRSIFGTVRTFNAVGDQ
jgi:polysaccharide biosynthesis/export protein